MGAERREPPGRSTDAHDPAAHAARLSSHITTGGFRDQIVFQFRLLTWTCYGTWLPGDSRGFVGNVRETDGSHVNHNEYGTPFSGNMPRLEAWVRERMRGEPVSLEQSDADAMIAQYRETARIRKWSLEAASVMFNHTHLVVGVTGESDTLLDTFKGWATRSVKKRRPLPSNGTFWTVGGSNRLLPDETAVRSAVVYVVKKQPNPLATWFAQTWQSVLDEYEKERR